MSIAARVKALREERGKTQAEVAAAIGVSQPAYHYLESGGRRIFLHHLAALAGFYRVKLAELAAGYEPTPREARLAKMLKVKSEPEQELTAAE